MTRFAHCGAAPTETFTASMCADTKNPRIAPLCDACDVELNRLLLDFLRVRGRARMMAAYAARERG